MSTIYLDNNATTPILPEVVQAMLIDLDGIPRNPSSITRYGREGRDLLIQARKQIASYFNVLPEEIYFTSGGTEGNHFLIQGFHKRFPGTIYSTTIEHPSVLKALPPHKLIPVDETGAPTLDAVEEALLTRPAFLVLSGAYTETGVLLPLHRVADLCKKHDTPLIIDGVGLLGKVPLNALPEGVSAISFSGHKCHGPKGIGFVILRKRYRIPPLLRGGHQEKEMRAGTENLSGILGLAKAISLIDPNHFTEMQHLRDLFESRLVALGCEVNGHGRRLPNTTNLYFPDVDAETLLIQLDQQGVIASLGSACSAGTLSPSHVLLGMGYAPTRALSSLRFSLSRLTTAADIARALSIIESLLPSKKQALLLAQSHQ